MITLFKELGMEILSIVIGGIYVYGMTLYHIVVSRFMNMFDPHITQTIREIIQSLKDTQYDIHVYEDQYRDIITILTSHRYLIFLHSLLEKGDRIISYRICTLKWNVDATLEMTIKRGDMEHYIYCHHRDYFYGGRGSNKAYYHPFIMGDTPLDGKSHRDLISPTHL